MTAEKATTMATALLPEARLWIRKTAAKLDDEIQQTTAAGLLDLFGAGVVRIEIEDPLIKQAAKLYLKAQFGFSAESEKYEAAYERLKAALSLNSYYNAPEVTVDG